tara:strand:+ start:1713 stop:2540 length:828 start_codon:yes stop_codon:yes gene_type:complete
MIKNHFHIIILLFGSLLAEDQGKLLYNDKKFEEAIKYYEKILKKNSDFDVAKFGIGASAYQLGEKEAAISIFNDISSLADSSLKSKAFYNIATLMSEKNQLKESLAYLRKSIELDSNNEDARINYELLKRMINQNKQQSKSNGDSEKNREDEPNDDNKKNEKKESTQKENDKKNNSRENQDNKELNPSELNEGEDQKGEKSNQADNSPIDKDEYPVDQIDELESEKKTDNKNLNYDKTDKQLQAEAILEALKDNDKINQRRKISGKKSFKLLKDW